MFKQRAISVYQLVHSQKYRFAQRFLFLFGAPGVGKGTYAKMLRKDLKLNHISTGDEIRKILKGEASTTFNPSLKAEIEKIVNAGKLVNDEIVVNIIQEKLKEPESANGIILDGFPRTESQLQKYDAQGLPIDLVVNLNLDKSVLFEKLLGRRVCNGCGATYNYCTILRGEYDMPPMNPKKKGVCDKCGSTDIVSRVDDSEQIISSRMIEYEQKTLPILNLFEKRTTIFNFEAKKGVRDYPKLLEEISLRLQK